MVSAIHAIHGVTDRMDGDLPSVARWQKRVSSVAFVVLALPNGETETGKRGEAHNVELVVDDGNRPYKPGGDG